MSIVLNGTTGITSTGITETADGNVGIGTTTHYDGATKLTVAGRINTSNGTAIGSINYGGGSVVNMGSLSNHPLQLITNNTTRMVIDTSGNVGIGTSSPNAKLDIVATTNTIRLGRSTSSYATIDSNSDAGSLALNADAGNTAGGGSMTFNFAGSEKMRIDSSGNLLVGTTSQISSGFVNVSVSQDARNGIVVNDTFTGAGNNNPMIFRRNGSQVGSIGTTTTTTAYNTSSDYRLKNTITPMTGALEKVALLKPCTYKWNLDGSDGQGFIAHELDEVVSGCVTGAKDAVDAEGNPQYQSIDTSFLVATLTAAIQEQQAIIKSLTARVVALEGQP